MTKLTEKDVLHVAKLASLPISKKETQKYLKQLSEVIDFIGALEEVDVSKLTPTSQTTGLENVFRTDEVNEAQVLPQEEALSGTEGTHNGYFKVGAVLTQKKDK